MNKVKLLQTVGSMHGSLSLYLAIPFPAQSAAEAWLSKYRQLGYYGRVVPDGQGAIALITYRFC
jgi:hypothetical protein